MTLAQTIPQFLPGARGNLFALYHVPPIGSTQNIALLYVHPFADEMNHSRRFMAEMSRQLARRGLCVLQVDLHGCGESDGDFSEARWEIWLADLAVSVAWLRDRGWDRVGLLGLRFGCILAMDFARQSMATLDRLILLQPVLSGEAMITQFLAIEKMSRLLNFKAATAPGIRGSEMHTILNVFNDMIISGLSIEVMGYRLAAQLGLTMKDLDLRGLIDEVKASVLWIEVVPGREHPTRKGVKEILETWNRAGVTPRFGVVIGNAFWSSSTLQHSSALLSELVGLIVTSR